MACVVAAKILFGALRRIAVIRFVDAVKGQMSLQCSALTANGFAPYTTQRHVQSAQNKASYACAANATSAYARNVVISVAWNLVNISFVDIVKKLEIWHLH